MGPTAHPNPVIVGPSTNHFDWGYLTEFLRFARDHDVLPECVATTERRCNLFLRIIFSNNSKRCCLHVNGT